MLTAGVSVLLGALVSIVPALRSTKLDLSGSLKDGGHSTAGRARHRLRNFPVGTQVALAFMLVVAASLFTRGFLGATKMELEFDGARTYELSVQLRRDDYGDKEARAAYAQRALEAVKAVPGVEMAAVSSSGFMNNWRIHQTLNVQGLKPMSDEIRGSYRCVSRE